MNQEPVAWMSPDGKVSQTEGKLFHIPLYTKPQQWHMVNKDGYVKPLSDEELDKEASIKMNQIMMDLIDSEDWNKGCTKQHLVNFARAILERHGIK
jgi:hypothetical protein